MRAYLEPYKATKVTKAMCWGFSDRCFYPYAFHL